MRDLYCRLLLLSFPASIRERVGRQLAQTLLADSTRASGRLAPWRLLVNSLDVVRAGLAERARHARESHHASEARTDPFVVERRAGGRWRSSLGADLRHARRSLARRPTFALTVFATLALGLGLITAVFSVVNGVLLNELPYRDPARLAFMWTKLDWIGVPRAWVAGPHIDRLTREAPSVESIVPLRTSEEQLIGDGTPEVVRAGWTTGTLFDVLGVSALHGRTFVTDDEPRNVAILGHALWQQRFGGDPAVIGRTIELGENRLEVVGVMPKDFHFLVHASLGGPRQVDVWLPTRWPLSEMSDGAFGFAALVRVRPASTLAQAQAELDVIARRLDAERYKSRGFGWQLVGVQDDLVKDARPALLLILAAASLLLIVVCANVVGLLLVRHADRRREFAVRTALGARRGDVVRLVVVECLVLSFAAGAAGLALAWMFVRAIAASGAVPVPRLDEVTIDWTSLGFVLVLALAAGLAASVLPAWRFARAPASSPLAEAARGSSGRTSRGRAVLVAAELALAVVLVAGCALLLRSYGAMRAVDPGFDPTGTLTADIRLLMPRYPQEAQAVDFFARVTDALRAVPGVTAVGASTAAPLDADADQAGVVPRDWVPPPGANPSIMVDLIRSTPGYFAATGIDLVAGRDFTWSDRAGAQPVAIVDATFARQAWPNAEAVGKTVSINTDATPVTIVGVVRHARQYKLEADDRPQVFRPYAQDTTLGLTLAIRTAADPETLVDPLRRAVWAIDPKQPIAGVTTLRRAVDQALLGRRLQLEALGAFATGAALLSAIGLYGLLASIVGERTREIGIRMALGADRRAVRRMVGRRVLLITSCGLITGAIAAGLAARMLAPFLFGVTPRDPFALTATFVLLVMLVAVASYVPVRRATSVDPARALRSE